MTLSCLNCRAQMSELAKKNDFGNAFPGIERTPGVVGSEPRVAHTRVPVYILEQARRLGSSGAT